MTSGDQHLVDMRLAYHQLMLALMTLLSLNDEADQVRVSCGLQDGRMTTANVDYYLKGKPLGGFAQ